MSKFNFNPPNHFIPSRVNVAPGSLWSAGSEAGYTIKHIRGLGGFFFNFLLLFLMNKNGLKYFYPTYKKNLFKKIKINKYHSPGDIFRKILLTEILPPGIACRLLKHDKKTPDQPFKRVSLNCQRQHLIGHQSVLFCCRETRGHMALNWR